LQRSIQHLALALLFLGLMSTRARADFIFDVTIPASGTGTLGFTITSNDNTTLSAFGLGLMISPTSSGFPYFPTTQPTPYDDPNYVFAGESAMSPLPFWFTYPAGDEFPTTVNGGDIDASSLGYVTITTQYDLATVMFQVTPAGAPEQVQITLVSDPGFTYFDDLNNNPLNYTASMVGGVVNINVSAVPEPSSLALAGISSLAGLLVYGRSRRRAESPMSTRRGAG
jgi:hypothetical protein